MCLLAAVGLSLLLASCSWGPRAPTPAKSGSLSTTAPTSSPVAAGDSAKDAALTAALAAEAKSARRKAIAAAQKNAAEKEESAPQTRAEVEQQVAHLGRPAPVAAQAPPPVPAAIVSPATKQSVQKAASTPEAADRSVSPYIFRVASGLKNSTHPFYGVGSKYGFIVNGVQGKELILVRGKTYTFKVNTDVKHDFYISKSPVGWGASTYTQGVDGNFTYRGTVTIKPTASTPNILYFQCRNHKNMGGVMHIVNPGEEAKVKLVTHPAALTQPVAGKTVAKKLDPARVKQKIAFADMFINQSAAARRIAGSGDLDAAEMYRSAQTKFRQSRDALQQGNAVRAMALVNESLRLMSEAARRAPAGARAEVQAARFKEMLDGTKTFASSYRRNYQRLTEQKGAKGAAKLVKVDMKAIDTTIAKARQLATDRQYSEAIILLSKAQETLTSALSKMLNAQTMSYELVFKTLKDEYKYELARYQSYEELVPVAIEQRRPPKQSIELMNGFVARAKEIEAQAVPVAESGDYKKAIQMIQGATSHIQRALRMVGVR